MAIKKEDYDFLYKIILVGDPKVGKTSFLTRYTKNIMHTNQVPTIGVEYSTKCVVLKNGEGIVKTQIWDTSLWYILLAGSEKYKSITTAHYRKAVGALLFYDLTDRESFENTQNWLKEIQMHATEGIVIMLIGNKLDLIDEDPAERKIPIETVNHFCRSLSLIYQETSAKTGFNVKESFEELINQIYSNDRKMGKTKDEPYENIMITPINQQQRIEVKKNSQESSCPCN